MAKRKKPVKKQKNKSKTYKFGKRFSFSKKQSIIFMLAFAVIGGYFLFRAYAASAVGQTEGETLVSSGAVVSDLLANGGKALKLTTSTPATGSLTTTAPGTNVVIHAKGTQCSGAPQAQVKIDGVQALLASVSGTTWGDYIATIPVNQGTHTLSVTFTNPYYFSGHGKNNKGSCTRQLYLDYVQVQDNTPPPPTIDTTAPTVSISSPTNGATVTGTVNITANASDNVGVSKVEFYLDGILKSTVTATPFNYTWDTTASTNASHTISVKAYDAANNSSGASEAVTVSNQAVSSYIFDDEFNAAAGTAPNPNYWIPLTWHMSGSDSNVNNVFHDGKGNLVLRARRDSTTATGYSGAWLNTFSWDGHPAKTIKVKAAPPFRVESRMLMANVDGSWPGLWTDDATSPDSLTHPNLELDVSEERTTYPTQGICHSHLWVNDGGYKDVLARSGSTTITDMKTNWHVYWANVYADHAVVGVDSQTCGTLTYSSFTYNSTTYPFSLPSQSFLLQNLIANPSDPGGSWASGGKQPAASDPGPWDALVDYIRVTTL